MQLTGRNQDFEAVTRPGGGTTRYPDDDTATGGGAIKEAFGTHRIDRFDDG